MVFLAPPSDGYRFADHSIARIRLHHMDLYRLKGGSDLRVLGIPEVLKTSVCLIEWPDRLGAAQPADRLGEEISSYTALC